MTSIEKIETINGKTVLVLSPELMAEMELTVGDEVEIATVDRTLTMRPIEEGERAKLIADLSEKFIQERRNVYKALAEGAK